MNAHMARVCVVGNAALDLTFRVRHLPRAGETALALDTTHDFGGKGANQAVMARRAGAEVMLFAALGSDADGERILAQLLHEGIDTRHVARLPCATDISIVTVDRRGENTIVTRNDAAAGYAPAPAALLDATRMGDWIALQGNLDEAVTAAILREAHANQRRTLFNPGPVRFDCRALLDDVDILVVNRVEAAVLSQHNDPAQAARLLRASGAREVIVTLGAEGVLWSNSEEPVLIPAMPAETIDTVGAGDAFCGALLAALARGVDMTDALRQAQAAAAFAVARNGTQAAFPSREQLLALFHSLT
jgi:ribokinase